MRSVRRGLVASVQISTPWNGTDMLKLAYADLSLLDVPAEVGAEFETNEIDVTLARYRITALAQDGAWIKRLSFVRDRRRASGIVARPPPTEEGAPAPAGKRTATSRG